MLNRKDIKCPEADCHLAQIGVMSLKSKRLFTPAEYVSTASVLCIRAPLLPVHCF